MAGVPQCCPGRGASRPARLCGIALVLSCVPAAEAGILGDDVRFGGLIRYTSDYVYRGYSKSADHPTIQLHGSAESGAGWFAGAWAAAVEFGDARFEINPYAGWQFGLGPDWQLETAVAGYVYDARTYGDGHGFADLGARLRFRDLASVRVSTAPDAYGTGKAVTSFEADVRYPLTDVTELSALAGHSLSRDALDYDQTWFGVGLTHYLGRHVALELRYQGARENNGADSHGGHAGRAYGYGGYLHARAARTADSAAITDRAILSLSIGF